MSGMLEVLERLLYVWRKHDSNDDAFWHIARATNRIRIVRASGGGERAVQQFIRHHRRKYTTTTVNASRCRDSDLYVVVYSLGDPGARTSCPQHTQT